MVVVVVVIAVVAVVVEVVSVSLFANDCFVLCARISLNSGLALSSFATTTDNNTGGFRRSALDPLRF